MSSYYEKKKKKNKTYFRNKIQGRRIVLEEKYTTESPLLGLLFEHGYSGVLPTKIETSILEKLLGFCEKRGEIKKLYAHDEILLQQNLNIFDSSFRKQFQNHDDAIGLVGAAAKLNIKTLYDLLFEDVVHMIDHKTPQEIENIFTIRYNGDDHRLLVMEHIMDTAVPSWAWKEVV